MDTQSIISLFDLLDDDAKRRLIAYRIGLVKVVWWRLPVNYAIAPATHIVLAEQQSDLTVQFIELGILLTEMHAELDAWAERGVFRATEAV